MKVEFNPKFLTHRLYDLMVYYGFEYAEFQQSLVTMVWGVWVANPWADIFDKNPQFWEPLSKLGPRQFWGVVFMVASIYQVWALLTDKLPHRRRATLLTCMLWMFLGFLFISRIFDATSVPLYYVFAAQNAWCFIRMRSEVT